MNSSFSVFLPVKGISKVTAEKHLPMVKHFVECSNCSAKFLADRNEHRVRGYAPVIDVCPGCGAKRVWSAWGATSVSP